MRPLPKLAPAVAGALTLVLAACGTPTVQAGAGPSASTSPEAIRDHARHVSRSLIRPSRAATASANSKPRPRSTPARPTPARGSGWVRAMELCIAHFESHGNLKAHSSAGPGYWGRYQFEDGLFHGATGLYGHASAFSAAIQDAAFLTVFAGGKGRHRWPNTYRMCRATLGGPA